MVEQWLIFRQDQQFGPYRWEEVLYHARSGRIEPSDILWRSQGGSWLWASQVPGLLSPDFSRPEKRPTVHKRRILIAANGILSLLLVLSLIFLLLPPRIQDFPETSETETSVAGTEAPAPAPAILIEHPSGLLLDAPEGAYKADTVLVVSTSNEGPATTPFEQRGPAYVIESLTLDIADKPVTIDLPVDSREGNQVVLFFSLGRWIRIPSEAVTDQSGNPVLRVQIDGLPTPWFLTAAKTPGEISTEGNGLVEGNARFAVLARLEQLRITDRSAYQDEAARLETFDVSFSKSRDQSADPIRLIRYAPVMSVKSVEDHLESARSHFLRAYGLYPGDYRANEAYLDGLRALWQARTTLLDLRPEDRLQPFDDQSEGSYASGLDYIYGGSLPLVDMVQFYCGTFAPWGLELMIRLLEDEDRWYLDHFDLRVLEFYGQLPFVDMPFPGGEQPVPMLAQTEGFDASGRYPYQYIVNLETHQRKLAADLNILEGEAMTHSVLRIYSPRLNRMTTQEMLALFKNVKSGYSALMGLALLIKGAPAVGIAGSVWAAYAVTAPLLEFMFLDSAAQATESKEIMSETEAVTVYQAGKMIGSLIHHGSLDSGAVPITAGALTDMVLSHIIDYDQIAQTNDLRLASGSRNVGYRKPDAWFWQQKHFYMPPILILAHVSGPTGYRPHEKNQRMPVGPEGSYTTGAMGMFEMSLIYGNLGVSDLGQSLDRGHANEFSATINARLQSDAPYGSHLQVFRLPGPNQLVDIDNAPDFQVIRWDIEKETLKLWAGASDLKKWQDLLDKAVVEVYAADRPIAEPDASLMLRYMDNQQGDGQTNHLAWHEIEAETEVHLSFALAIFPDSRPFNRPQVNQFDEHQVGRWYTVPWYNKRLGRSGQGYLALSYFVRISLDEEILAEYPVHFGNRARPGTREIMFAGPETISKPGYLWGTWQEKVDQFVVEIGQVMPPEGCPGTYLGSIEINSPELSVLGLDGFRIDLAITIAEDQSAEMAWEYEQDMRLPVAPGVSVEIEWTNEALLKGQCRSNQILLEGIAISSITQRNPDPLNPGERQEITVDSRETVIVSAVMEGNVIQGTLTMGEGNQQVTHEFKAVRKD